MTYKQELANDWDHLIILVCVNSDKRLSKHKYIGLGETERV